MTKTEKVLREMERYQKEKVTGSITINYSQGGITHIEKKEVTQ